MKTKLTHRTAIECHLGYEAYLFSSKLKGSRRFFYAGNISKEEIEKSRLLCDGVCKHFTTPVI